MLQGIIDFINKNAGLLVAILALFVSIYESYRQRKHTRLSVQPLIEGKYEIVHEKAEAFLENVGIGPAKITEYKILVDDKEVERMDVAFNNISKTIKIPQSTIYLEKFNSPKMLRPSERITVFCATPPSETKFDLPELAIFSNITKKINVLIVYESMYKEEQKKSIRFNAI